MYDFRLSFCKLEEDNPRLALAELTRDGRIDEDAKGEKGVRRRNSNNHEEFKKPDNGENPQRDKGPNGDTGVGRIRLCNEGGNEARKAEVEEAKDAA